MKNAPLLIVALMLAAACGRTEKNDTTTQSTAAIAADSSASAKTQNCQSVVDAAKLGKADVYQESAKSISVTLTLEQDTSTTSTAKGCYFNNTVTVLAAKKSGSRVFKRTLLKDDLLYFTQTDEIIKQSVLQNVVYKPTFNSQRFITITMHLIEPVSKKTADYTLFMNYFGEIVKVRREVDLVLMIVV